MLQLNSTRTLLPLTPHTAKRISSVRAGSGGAATSLWHHAAGLWVTAVVSDSARGQGLRCTSYPGLSSSRAASRSLLRSSEMAPSDQAAALSDADPLS